MLLFCNIHILLRKQLSIQNIGLKKLPKKFYSISMVARRGRALSRTRITEITPLIPAMSCSKGAWEESSRRANIPPNAAQDKENQANGVKRSPLKNISQPYSRFWLFYQQ